MDILIILSLIIAGVLLFMVEIFLIPGISVAGIAAGICLLYANYHAFAHMGATAGCITLLISVAGCAWAFIRFMRSKTLDKLSLKKDIDAKVENKSAAVQVGDKGVCITRLALIGNAEINGQVIEVKSADGFLDESTPIVVERIVEGVIIVKKQL